MEFAKELASQFSLQEWQAEKVIALIDEGNTIPFIARYRKEAHGSLDDQTLRRLAERLEALRGLEKRRGEVRGLIEAAGALTPEIGAALDAAATMTELEDLYRPFRPKRRTRASMAREKGLEPLADFLFRQERTVDPAAAAARYVDAGKGVETAEDALAGARDILAERISDDASLRGRLRTAAMAQAELVSQASKPEEDSVYAPYYEFRQPVRQAAGYRVLAVNRGEREGFLKVSVAWDRERALPLVEHSCVRGSSPCAEQVRLAAHDAFDRLIFPSLEREIRAALTEQADESAIRVFRLNLRQLLMQPPVRGRTVLGLDPGYRTGCKAAVVDPTGRVLDTGVIYPTHSQARREEAARTLRRWIEKHGVQAIAIGNGTASRETEIFTADVLSALREEGRPAPAYAVVSEAGASVYSASPLAAAEFPAFDVTLRSAVSIARRLQDPLAELVKIDPKAIGVGQYQHDMPPKQLGEALDGVVEDCVNTVGVDLNTASPSLLGKVSGLSAAVAKNIVAYREENGAFPSRAALRKVPKLGPRTFQQCAGFLRVPESRSVLDHTAVHPESYAAAESLLALCGRSLEDVGRGTLGDLRGDVAKLGFAEAARRVGVGEPTLRDMVEELLRPGRDPRDELPAPLLRTDVMGLEDLKPGMELQGTVRNVVDFGAFVDIGVHQDGLVHISQICDRFLRHPSEAVQVGDVVRVRVLSVDGKKKRISLTMRGLSPQ